MDIETLMKPYALPVLPKLYRVVKVKLSVLRACADSNGGIMFDQDTTVERKVKRVLCSSGWKWVIHRECKNQEEWDYYLEEDSICLDDLNYELGLI